MKRIAVIGAGPCGLVALKEMIEGGHDAILLERTSDIGGVFSSNTIYPDLHLTISNWAMAFSDFPDPQRLCYPSATDYLNYLRSYARHFDLERHIIYNAEVTSASYNNNQWLLEVQENETQAGVEYAVDALIVATGANQLPQTVPPELKPFSGLILHSSDYDTTFRANVRKNKLRVLVIGGGESGADISADLGTLTPHTTVWLRRAICIGPRYLTSLPEMSQVASNKTTSFPANSFLEAATTNRMSAAQNVYTYGFFRKILWHTSVLNRTLSNLCLTSTESAPLMNDQATYVTKNQRMCEAWESGIINVRTCPQISVRGRTVRFHTSARVTEPREFDAVVLCTGFRCEFPWLKVKNFDKNPRAWYLHCFPKDMGQCLFFVGYARPHQGGIPAMAEMLARYVALLLRGERELPRDYAERARRDGEAEREYYHLSPNLHTLVDYNAFLESVARKVGWEPRLPLSCVVVFNIHMLSVGVLALGLVKKNWPLLGFRDAVLLWTSTLALFFFLHDGIMIKWWFFPNWSVWYRQRGPGSNPLLLDNVLRRVNVWKSTGVTTGFVLLVFWSWATLYMQWLISMALFIPYAVLSLLGHGKYRMWGTRLLPKLFVLHDAQWRIMDLFSP
ncbi:FAD/NAD(P)-binding domain-containing protein [Polyplosphaeria fusca]|uniref:FAD/NAD(P)-binding domain-containing protein n=1 Tax=Polyplosphaeria fusca TaxID=682080 RepID=A0A9P4V3X7_9PLEO|nr:FAD/NAD(P)-binding domain-containing protein [Polyplosphaeria fusca]